MEPSWMSRRPSWVSLIFSGLKLEMGLVGDAVLLAGDTELLGAEVTLPAGLETPFFFLTGPFDLASFLAFLIAFFLLYNL